MLNVILNKQVETSASRKDAYLSYQRHRVVDKFYHTEGGNIRVTTDEASGRILAFVIKERLADMHVHFPNAPFDIRISVNVEKPVAHQIEDMVSKGIPKFERMKNRVSYTLHQRDPSRSAPFLSCDLTQVGSTLSGPSTHEFEVELGDPASLLHENSSLESILSAYWTSIRQLAFSVGNPIKFE